MLTSASRTWLTSIPGVLGLITFKMSVQQILQEVQQTQRVVLKTLRSRSAAS